MLHGAIRRPQFQPALFEDNEPEQASAVDCWIRPSPPEHVTRVRRQLQSAKRIHTAPLGKRLNPSSFFLCPNATAIPKSDAPVRSCARSCAHNRQSIINWFNQGSWLIKLSGPDTRQAMPALSGRRLTDIQFSSFSNNQRTLSKMPFKFLARRSSANNRSSTSARYHLCQQ